MNGTIYGDLEDKIVGFFEERGIQSAQLEGRAAKWHRRQGISYANSRGPVKMSQHRYSVCGVCGQGPGVLGTALGIPLKCGSLGKLSCPPFPSNPNSASWGCSVGGPHPPVSVLFTPQAFLSFGKNGCRAEKPWEALLCLLRNRKSLFAQSKQTHKLQGSLSVQMQSQEVCVGAEGMGT